MAGHDVWIIKERLRLEFNYMQNSNSMCLHWAPFILDEVRQEAAIMSNAAVTGMMWYQGVRWDE